MTRFLFFVLALQLLSQPMQACWFYDPEEEYYHFYDREAMSDSSLVWLMDSKSELALYYYPKTKQVETDYNLLDWQRYTGNGVSVEDLKKIIYELPATELKNWEKNKELAKNSFIAFCQKESSGKAIVDYLLFAKACENQAMIGIDPWATDEKRSKNEMLRLLKQGEKAYTETKDPFLRQRYAYQNVRLAHYLQDGQKAVNLSKQYEAEAKEKGYMYYRMLEHKAGALSGLKNPESAYLYALVFDQCPDRRQVAVLSFQLHSFDSWQKAQVLCRSPREKALLHVLRALDRNSNLGIELEAIHRLDPQNPYLEMLFSRFVGQIQSEAFPKSGRVNQYPSLKEESDATLLQMRTTVQALAQGNPKNDYWTFAQAYVELLLRNYTASMAWAGRIGEGSRLYQHAQNLVFIAQLCALPMVDAAAEERIGQAFRKLGKQALPGTEEFMFDVFAAHYRRQGEAAKSFLCYNNLQALHSNLDLNLIEAIRGFVAATKQGNAFEQLLLAKCGTSAMDELNEMRGTYYFQRNQLDQAIEAFKSLSAEYQKSSKTFNNPYLKASIFSSSIKLPLFDVDINAQGKLVKFLAQKHSFLNKTYNKLSLAEQFKDLEQRAKDNPEFYYLLACAWLQISPYAWHRPAIYYTDSNAGGSEWFNCGESNKPSIFHKHYAFGEYKYYNPQIALTYLDKALQGTTDKEQAAEIAFTRLKALQYQSFVSEPYYGWSDAFDLNPSLVNQYKDYLKEYRQTQYAKQAIQECSDLANFTR